jgi:hypothetical protein
MDMSRYAGTSFLKFEDVAAGPRQEKITGVDLGKYDKPILEFESGDRLSLNATNSKTLVRAYGAESDDWIGMVVELFPGQTEFQGKPQDSVLVRPISPGRPLDERTPVKSEMDDDIPF